MTEADATIDGYNWTAPAAQRFTINATNLHETLNFTNIYTQNAPATTSVTVTKVWNDNDNSLEKRPESVTVKLLNGDRTVVETLTLNKGNNWKDTFTKVPADGNYEVSEVAVDGYTSQVIKPQKPVVTIGKLTKVPDCSTTAKPIGTANLVVVNKGNTYGVWTQESLDGHQEALKEALKNAGYINNDNSTVTFHSGTDFPEDVTIDNGNISFSNKNTWSMFWYGNVAVSESDGFTIVNTLNIEKGELIPATLTIKKVDAGDSTPLSGAKFTLTNEDGQLVGGKALVTGEDGICSFPDLTAGTYTLEETKAPGGYEKSSLTWTVTVEETKDIQEVKDVATGAVVGYKEVTTCTVSMDGADKDNDGYIIPNTELPEPYTVEIPVTKNVTISRGSKVPVAIPFTFKAYVGDQEVGELKLTPTKDSDWTATGMLQVSIPYDLFEDRVATVTIKEIPGGDTRWKYDTKVYTVTVRMVIERAVAEDPLVIMLGNDKVESVSFENIYSYKYTPTPRPTTPTTVTSVKTGDMGVALYAGLAILSMTGSAGVILRRRKNDK